MRSCDDGESCTAADMCASGACLGTSRVCGDGVLQTECNEACDNANLLAGDGSSATCELESCGPAPEPVCERTTADSRAGLRLRRGRDGMSRLGWRWHARRPAARAEFGDPLARTNYRLCVYDGLPRLLRAAELPAGGLCGGRRRRLCWRDTPRGFRYGSAAAAAGELRYVELVARPDRPAIRVASRQRSRSPCRRRRRSRPWSS